MLTFGPENHGTFRPRYPSGTFKRAGQREEGPPGPEHGRERFRSVPFAAQQPKRAAAKFEALGGPGDPSDETDGPNARSICGTRPPKGFGRNT